MLDLQMYKALIDKFIEEHVALDVSPRRAFLKKGETETESVASRDVIAHLDEQRPLLVNAPLVARRLKVPSLDAFDILELFSFVRPATFLVPTIAGLQESLKITNTMDPLFILQAAARRLLMETVSGDWSFKRGAATTLEHMKRVGWAWADILCALNAEQDKSPGLWALYREVPEWHEKGGSLPPLVRAVADDEVRETLSLALGKGSEHRKGQEEMALKVGHLLRPGGNPHAGMLEAGTGIGKTLAYLAPAKAWAEKAEGTVWVSTYTRNLQRQINNELKRLYPEKKERKQKTSIRKGRENYACLLNMEGALDTGDKQHQILNGLLARWILYTRDGDINGGDLPGWLSSLFGGAALSGITDRRGECIYSACPHYTRCFIERARRPGPGTKIVVANHALALTEAARRAEVHTPLSHIVFDEGHHLFDAADSAFSLHLTGLEGSELRRWLMGGEGRRKSRARGLRGRFGALAEEERIAVDLGELEKAASFLPRSGWLKRLQMNDPQGPYERFLALIRAQIFQQNTSASSLYNIEALPDPVFPGFLESADTLGASLQFLANPMAKLAKKLGEYLHDEGEELSQADKGRIDSFARSLRLRVDTILSGWIPMLGALAGEGEKDFVDWVALDRIEGRELDIGLHRHYLDPTRPLAESVYEEANSIIVTSATLRDKTVLEEEAEDSWASAEIRSGLQHLVQPAERITLPSPFDYVTNSRVLIVNDLRRGNVDQLAHAMRLLMMASGGRALGLFTAIATLRDVYHRIAAPLDETGLSLYAQHIDPMDTGTLVDIFRAEKQACLLGTDALRDGVDVPGESLSMVMFDKIPWPRPTILHKARRAAFGGQIYDEMLVRLKLKQAFGRLIRSNKDKGIFLILDSATPSRLLNAFPEGVSPRRLGLKEALEEVRSFLKQQDFTKTLASKASDTICSASTKEE